MDEILDEWPLSDNFLLLVWLMMIDVMPDVARSANAKTFRILYVPGDRL